jgi:sugar/nucleoside kinase (ribokinase family)
VTGEPRRLVLVGSVIADLLMSVPELPERGGDVLASATSTQVGGGFNVLAAAVRLGLPAALAGHVGDGPFGRMVAAALAGEGITPLLPVARGDTGFCVGFVEPDAERTFVTSPGVESRLDAADLAAVDVGPGDAVYVSGYDLCYPVTGPVVADWCAGLADALLVLDPGPLVLRIPAEVLDSVLRSTDVLTLNEREARLLAGTDAGLRARLRPSTVLLVRRGPRGCTLYPPGGAAPEDIAAPVVAAVDTTGAGDAHTGALLAALRDTGSWPESVRVANAAAAFAVTRRGSATAPTRTELASMMWNMIPE